MKTATCSLLLSALLILPGCNLIEDLIKFPIRLNTEVTVPAGSGIGSLLDLTSDETETHIDDELELNDSRKDRVKTISLRECVLTITSPSGEDFSFVNDIEVFLYDEEIGEMRIAWIDDVPDDIGGELELDVNHADAAAYLKKESVRFKTNITTDEVLLQNVDVNIYTRFRVTADIF